MATVVGRSGRFGDGRPVPVGSGQGSETGREVVVAEQVGGIHAISPLVGPAEQSRNKATVQPRAGHKPQGHHGERAVAHIGSVTNGKVDVRVGGTKVETHAPTSL